MIIDMKITNLLPDKAAIIYENGKFYIGNDCLNVYLDNKMFVIYDDINTFDYSENNNLVEVSCNIEWTVPRDYKSLSKKILEGYHEDYRMDIDISGIYYGISILTNEKYLFIVNEYHSQSIMIDKKGKLSMIPIGSIEDKFKYYLLADGIKDELNLTFTIRNV